MVASPLVFPELFASQPPFVRRILRSAVGLDHLESLYASARSKLPIPFSTSVLEALDIRLTVEDEDLLRIPATGPVVAVANHPHGFLDGFVLDHLIAQRRPDCKLLVNEMISRFEGMSDRCIAVDVFAPGRSNIKAARQTLAWLGEQHAVAVFPAGEVSHWRHALRRVADGPWNEALVRWAVRSRAAIVPIYLGGANSVFFQLAGALAAPPAVRTAQLPNELRRKRSSSIEVRIGAPIRGEELVRISGRGAAPDYVRARVYMMAGRTGERKLRSAACEAPAAERTLHSVAGEIERLHRDRGCVLESSGYAVYAARGRSIPLIMDEIGRLREVTFRAAGEGTGRESDTDRFDSDYTHLVLWHRETATIAGSYRLAWTEDMKRVKDLPDVYTSSLFRYAPEFFSRLGPAVELGRSFIVAGHQRGFIPLLLLWQAIARCVAARPSAPVLFGAVSISSEYPVAARQLMVEFLRERCFRNDLAKFVQPRKPFAGRALRKPEIDTVVQCLEVVEDLPIADLGPQASVPVLLRQYLRLGGKVAAFNVDPHFSDTLDALLIVDLRDTPAAMLRRYLGWEAAGSFLQNLPAR